MIIKIIKKNIKIFFLISIIILIYFFNLIVIKPFPFFNVDYIKDIDKFNLSPLKDKKKFYKFNLNKQNIPAHIKEKLDLYLNFNIYDKIRISTELTRELQENSIGSELKSVNNVFLKAKNFHEICSESAKIFVSVMSYLNVTARVIWTNGHTVAEVWNGEKWIMTDTLSNIYALDKKDEFYLSFSELVSLYPEVKFTKITQKNYSLYDYHKDKKVFHKVIENNNLIFVIPNREIFSFHTKKKKISRVTNLLNFNNPYIAKQYIGTNDVNKVGNVGIYIYKRFFD